LWRIDLTQAVHILRHASVAYFAAAVAIWLVTVWPLCWRWQRLLAARGVHDELGWLTRTFFVSYSASQVLPTSLGGDATRFELGTRRHRGRGSEVSGSVLAGRALGGVATLALAAIGFLLAIGRYDVGAYLWIELTIAVAAVLGTVVLLSRTLRRPLRRLVPM